MHVRLLKKISAQHFVGRVLESNAIVRFQPARPLLAPDGVLCHVTNCIFDNTTKLVKCEAVRASETEPAQPDIAPAELLRAPAAPAARDPAPAPAPGPPVKRRRVCFADDEPACSASSCARPTTCA